MSVRVYLEIGHEASIRTKKTQEGFTHDWEVYVRGANDAEIHYYVEKVVFYLHETFPKPKRVIKEPPYIVKESGYAGFNLPIDIYLKNNQEPKKIRFNYDLQLQPAGPAIHNVQKEKYLFNQTSEDFRERLLKGGGKLGASSVNCEAFGTRSLPATLADDKQHLLSKPKFSAEVKTIKHPKPKIEEPRSINTSFQELFGTPITPSKFTSQTSVSDSIKNAKNQAKPVTTSGSKGTNKSPESCNSTKDVVKDKVKTSDDKTSKSGKDDLKKIKEESRDKKDKTVKSKSSGSSSRKDKTSANCSSNSNGTPPGTSVTGASITGDSPKKVTSLSVTDVSPKHVVSKSHDKKDEKKSSSKRKEKHRDKSGGGADVENNKDANLNHLTKCKTTESSKRIKDDETRSNVALGDDKKSNKKKHKDRSKDAKLVENFTISKSHPAKTSNDAKVNLKEPSNVFFGDIIAKTKSKSSQSTKALFDDADSSNSLSNDSGPNSPDVKDSYSLSSSLNDSIPSSQVKKSSKDTEIKSKPSKIKEKHHKSSKDKHSENVNKKSKRRSELDDSEEQPPEKLRFDLPNSTKDANVNGLSKALDIENCEQKPIIKRDPEKPLTDNEYMEMLRDLQNKIMALTNNADLQKVVQLIAETGKFEISAHTFDFDLCLLDRSTVQELQKFFATES